MPPRARTKELKTAHLTKEPLSAAGSNGSFLAGSSTSEITQRTSEQTHMLKAALTSFERRPHESSFVHSHLPPTAKARIVIRMNNTTANRAQDGTYLGHPCWFAAPEENTAMRQPYGPPMHVCTHAGHTFDNSPVTVSQKCESIQSGLQLSIYAASVTATEAGSND